MKHTHRFFISQPVETGMEVVLEEGDCFHAGKVLRLSPGDRVEIADSRERVYEGTVSESGLRVSVRAGGLKEAGPVTGELTVLQALTRGRKMDLVVEKLSELGVGRLVPVQTVKSVDKPASDGGKVARWRRIARASAAQARRSRVMEVEEPAGLIDWLSGWTGSAIVLATEAEAVPLGSVLERVKPPYCLVIGPEPGFEAGEIVALKTMGATFAGLGGLVLRTETAALVAATIVLHRQGSVG